MRYYIISGEASGDLHGSNLVKRIRTLDSEAEIRCFGGDLMQRLELNWQDITNKCRLWVY